MQIYKKKGFGNITDTIFLLQKMLFLSLFIHVS